MLCGMNMWRRNSDMETRHLRHFTSEQNEVSKSKDVEKVIPVAHFWMSTDDTCQKLFLKNGGCVLKL